MNGIWKLHASINNCIYGEMKGGWIGVWHNRACPTQKERKIFMSGLSNLRTSHFRLSMYLSNDEMKHNATVNRRWKNTLLRNSFLQKFFKVYLSNICTSNSNINVFVLTIMQDTYNYIPETDNDF